MHEAWSWTRTADHVQWRGGGSSLWIRECTPTNNNTYIEYGIYLIYVYTRMQLFVYGPTVKSEVSFDFCRGTRVGERESGRKMGRGGL